MKVSISFATSMGFKSPAELVSTGWDDGPDGISGDPAEGGRESHVLAPCGSWSESALRVDDSSGLNPEITKFDDNTCAFNCELRPRSHRVEGVAVVVIRRAEGDGKDENQSEFVHLDELFSVW